MAPDIMLLRMKIRINIVRCIDVNKIEITVLSARVLDALSVRCETCLYWEDFNGVCFCGASPYCADFTDGDDGCQYWQKKEPITPADTEAQ